jgi:hypothetical protein
MIVYVKFSSVGAGTVWGGCFFSSFWDPIWAEEDRGFKKDYERKVLQKKLKNGFKKDYEREVLQKKLISRSRQRLMTMSREGLRVGRRSRVHLCAMVLPSLFLDYRLPHGFQAPVEMGGRITAGSATRTTQPGQPRLES